MIKATINKGHCEYTATGSVLELMAELGSFTQSLLIDITKGFDKNTVIELGNMFCDILKSQLAEL